MRLLRLWCATLAGGLGAAHAALAPPGDWKLPPVDGELGGEFRAFALGSAPPLRWRVRLHTPKPLERTADFEVNAPGLRVAGAARVDPMGEGSWRIAEAQIGLGEWFAWLAPEFAPDMVAVKLSGTLQLSGDGTWRDGRLGGRAEVSLRDAQIDDPSHKVLLSGITCHLAITDFEGRRTAPSQVLTWTGGSYDQIALGPGRIQFALDGDTLHIERASIAIFGGELAVTGLSFSTRHPNFTVSAQATGFEVGEFLFLLPKVFARVQGRVDGYLDLEHTAKGFALGAGFLGLREGETAELQLTPKPGLLSGFLPPSINRIYPGIAKMESDGVPMRAEVLQMRFLPQRDELGRSAWIHVAGRPADPNFAAPLDLMVNIRGPLDEMLNFGANSAMRVMGRR